MTIHFRYLRGHYGMLVGSRIHINLERLVVSTFLHEVVHDFWPELSERDVLWVEYQLMRLMPDRDIRSFARQMLSVGGRSVGKRKSPPRRRRKESGL